MSDFKKPAWKRNERKRELFLRPLEVEVRDNDIEQAIKIFKNKIIKDGILTELRHRRFAEKPSEKKNRKHREALKKMRSKSRGRRLHQRQSRKKTNARIPKDK
jgi:small subunit ribosomal protein S21